MNIHDYLQGCLRTWDGENRLTRAVLGLVGEAGEVAEKYKKYLRGDYNDTGWRLSDDMHAQAYYGFKYSVKKELGDVIYYWAVLCYELGLDPAEVMEDNLKKLADRQARGKIKGDGDER